MTEERRHTYDERLDDIETTLHRQNGIKPWTVTIAIFMFAQLLAALAWGFSLSADVRYMRESLSVVATQMRAFDTQMHQMELAAARGPSSAQFDELTRRMTECEKRITK